MELVVSLGSNLGDRKQNLARALTELAKICKIRKTSKVIESLAWGKTDQADFLNQILIADTDLSPRDFLKNILKIELALGRVRKEKWGPRIIDIDIIYYGDMIIKEEDLQIPHPLLQERLFVLEPLIEVYENKIDPRFNLTARELYKNLITGEKMNKVGAIVLAAGKGTRMKSNKPKVTFSLAGKSLVERVVETASKLNSSLTCVIVGYKKDQVIELVDKYDNIAFAEQKEQLGTGHAVKIAKDVFNDFQGDIFILCGDVPLTRPETLEGLLKTHREQNAACTVLTHVIDDPARYGRIIRDANGNIDSIVEYKDASEEQRQIREINTGIYCFKKDKLFSALEQITNDNAQNEYYLPDTLKILNNENEIVAGHILDNFVEAAGINSQEQLAQLETEYYNDIKKKWLNQGVTIENPQSVIIGEKVIIERDVEISANTIIRGETLIKEASLIGPNSLIIDANIGEKTILKGYNIVVKQTLSDGQILDFQEKL
jgi:UDP-N-acetylglucosamine diphosphorylase/glucosamine-1-phosphate N-acetyltransferase/2-amino-4-hydroxy-6-hydroxymethyldihydropteridine diphosphokinase